ncbi:MAG: hypothetical protein HOC23_04030 [Halieaceae bacterium]|jgi:tRNA A-37 threonylcarbamoyl transferase component Bud32|nr:hypothetical protein [Halieaceae bacterium]
MRPSSARIMRGEVWAERLKALLATGPTDPIAWMDRNTSLLKYDAHSRVGLLQLCDQLCYLKLYCSKFTGQQLMLRMGYGRGFRSFDRAIELSAKQILVPQPLACIVIPGGMMLLTEGISSAENLHTMWLGELEQKRAETLLRAAGLTLAKLHSANYAHGDCKWSNLVWSGQQIHLVDLEAVARVRRGSKKLTRDVARFTLNAEELGVAHEQFDQFLGVYLDYMGMRRESLINRVMPVLRMLRARHLIKYGQQGHYLLGESSGN